MVRGFRVEYAGQVLGATAAESAFLVKELGATPHVLLIVDYGSGKVWLDHAKANPFNTDDATLWHALTNRIGRTPEVLLATSGLKSIPVFGTQTVVCAERYLPPPLDRRFISAAHRVVFRYGQTYAGVRNTFENGKTWEAPTLAAFHKLLTMIENHTNAKPMRGTGKTRDELWELGRKPGGSSMATNKT